MSRCLIATILIAVCLCSPMAAQDYALDSLRAGAEAYRDAEAQRRANVGEQIRLNDTLRYNAYGLPWPTPYGETIYYPRPLSVQPSAYGYVPSFYGEIYERRGLFGRYRGTYVRGLYFDPFYASTIYGYPGYAPFIRQPIGQQQEQTGPRRWESHPVYADEPAPVAEAPVIERAPATSEIPLRPRSGPREF